MTVLTMRYLRGHFVVTGPDIEPLKFKSRRPLARPNSVCVRDGLAGWGGGIRISAFRNRNSPRLSAWGGKIRTSAFRIGIHPDSQPRGPDSNLRSSNQRCSSCTSYKSLRRPVDA